MALLAGVERIECLVQQGSKYVLLFYLLVRGGQLGCLEFGNKTLETTQDTSVTL